MKLLLTRQPVEMPALRAWREKALNFLLQAILLFSGPPLLLDIVIGVQHGNIAKISADITYYVALTCFLLVKRIPFLLRATAILILGLGFHTYILMTGGLVSAGRLGILTDVIMAALLLGRLAAIVVWIAGGIAIAVGLIFFARQPVDVLADITSGLVKPSTLIAQGLFTVGLSGFLGGLVLWIFMRLNQSLHTTDQALAERDRTNTTLEQRVADRTTQLEQALDGLSRQLRYAEVLGHCSQLLLQQRGDATSRPALIETILHLLHSSVSASHLLIYRRNEHPMLAEPYVILGCAHAPQHHELILPTFAQIADMPDDIRQSLDAGQSFAGPVPGRFPDHPEFQQLFDQNGIQSVLLLPILLDGKPWGLLQATDCDRQRQWDSSSIQLLRTAAEMLATAQEGWAATQALAIREAQLRALRDALPDLLFIVHTDSTILDYHAPPHIQLILPPATFLGRPFTSLMPDVISSQAQFAIQRVTLTGEMETFEYSLWIDQQQQTYEARVVHIVGDTCMVVIRDITAQHEAATALLRAKEAAEAADHAKSTFLAHISHEIRTPLTAIIGMASLLRESPLSPSQREMATIIHTGSETLLGLIGDILDVSKIEAGQLDLILRPFDLSAVCRVAVNLMSHTAVQKNLLLNLQIDPQLPALLIGDSGRLRQVLVNLLSNAVKFTDHGRIDVIIEGSLLDTESCEVQITVRDTGVGIDTHQLSQIFKPFVQVNRRDHQVGGTGLGLTISKQLIDLMGGRLAVSSTLGEGTTFRLTLLLGIAVAESDQATVPQIAAQRTPQVLIVEDNT
ncbi:MAG: GAF domain-containing protein, partial [Oscillochloris sp.]|nr:GAF domain-containing protein [Oscillochloris sp.]